MTYPLPGIEQMIDGVRCVTDNELTQQEINDLASDFFFMAVTLYSDFKATGQLPYGGGTLCERPTTIQIIKLFECESNRVEIWKMKKRK